MGTVKCIMLFGLFLVYVHTEDFIVSNHWSLTNSTRIEPKQNSPYVLRNSRDLILFLKQDKRYNRILHLYAELKKSQPPINRLWKQLQSEVDIDTHTANNKHCQETVNMSNVQFYISHFPTPNEMTREDLKIHETKFIGKTQVPDCKKISSLIFSMFTFEHLDGMASRENLEPLRDELVLQTFVLEKFQMDMGQFGHWAASVLKHNTSSWMHYHFATYYWRYHSKLDKAMECVRRALVYAPREYKDLALLNLGSLLLNSGKASDAAIVLKAAVDYNIGLTLHHLILGNTYAVMGDFNSAIKHYNMSIRLNPEFKNPFKNRHAVLCLDMLSEHYAEVKRLIFDLRKELALYTQISMKWLVDTGAFLAVLSDRDNFDITDNEKTTDIMNELTKLDFKAMIKTSHKYTILDFLLANKGYGGQGEGVYVVEALTHWKEAVTDIKKQLNFSVHQIRFVQLQQDEDNIEIVKERQTIMRPGNQEPTEPSKESIDQQKKATEPPNEATRPPQEEMKQPKEATKLPEKGSEPQKEAMAPPKEATVQPKEAKAIKPRKKASIDDEDYMLLEYAVESPLYPSTMKVNRNEREFDIDPDWPPANLCRETWDQLSEIGVVYPVFLPFENKGLRLRQLLTNKIGLSASAQHALPWSPPRCSKDINAHKSFLSKKSRSKHAQHVTLVEDTTDIERALRKYVGEKKNKSVMDINEIGQRITTAMAKNLAPKWLLYTLASLYLRARNLKHHALVCLESAKKLVNSSEYRDIVLVPLASLYLELGFHEVASEIVEEAYRINMYEPPTNFLMAQISMVLMNKNTHMYHLRQVLRVEPNYKNGVAYNIFKSWSCVFKHDDAVISQKAKTGELEEKGVCATVMCEKDGKCRYTNGECFKEDEEPPPEMQKEEIIFETPEEATAKQKRPIEEEDFYGDGKLDYERFDMVVSDMPRDRADKTGHGDNYYRMMQSIEGGLSNCAAVQCTRALVEKMKPTKQNCEHKYKQLGYWLQRVSFFELSKELEYIRLIKEVSTQAKSSTTYPECKLEGVPSEDFFLERLLAVDTQWQPVISLMNYIADVYYVLDYGELGPKFAAYLENHPHSWLGLLGAGWWCGAAGRGDCAVKCLAASFATAPPDAAAHVLRAAVALLTMQEKLADAKNIAHLSFYNSPKSAIEALFLASTYAYNGDYEAAIWLYHYSLLFNQESSATNACLTITLCLREFGHQVDQKPEHDIWKTINHTQIA